MYTKTLEHWLSHAAFKELDWHILQRKESVAAVIAAIIIDVANTDFLVSAFKQAL